MASVFDGVTLLTWSVSVSSFMEFEKPFIALSYEHAVAIAWAECNSRAW